MFSGGSSQSISLLPDNPGVPISPVQGGGGSRVKGWVSNPVSIEESEPESFPKNLGLLLKFQNKWKQTLGPGIPSRRKPRHDPYYVIAKLNVNECPTFVVAPFHGDTEAANTVCSWANSILKSDPKVHIVFMGPLSNKSETEIEHKLLTLFSRFHAQVLYISDKESPIPTINGLILQAVPYTGKQVCLGMIPDYSRVYHSSSRTLDCLEVTVMKVPYSSPIKPVVTDDSIIHMKFNKPSRVKANEKDYEQLMLNSDHVFKQVPGWVTKVSFGYEVMKGGGDVEINVMTYNVCKAAMNGSKEDTVDATTVCAGGVCKQNVIGLIKEAIAKGITLFGIQETSAIDDELNKLEKFTTIHLNSENASYVVSADGKHDRSPSARTRAIDPPGGAPSVPPSSVKLETLLSIAFNSDKFSNVSSNVFTNKENQITIIYEGRFVAQAAVFQINENKQSFLFINLNTLPNTKYTIQENLDSIYKRIIHLAPTAQFTAIIIGGNFYTALGTPLTLNKVPLVLDTEKYDTCCDTKFNNEKMTGGKVDGILSLGFTLGSEKSIDIVSRNNKQHSNHLPVVCKLNSKGPEDKPLEGKALEDKALEAKPTEGKPTEAKPTEGKPTEGKPNKPVDNSSKVTVSLNDDDYKIRDPRKNPEVIEQWKKQEFTDDEARLLDTEGIRYMNTEIYSLFLQGLVNSKCSSESDIQLRPECKIFRFIMADTYYKKLKQTNISKQNIKVENTSSSKKEVTPTAAVIPTVAPLNATAAPPSTTGVPLNATVAPPSTTAAPINATVAPLNATAAPPSTTGDPTSTAAPPSTTAAPINATAAPLSTTAAPLSTTAAPPSTTAAPPTTTAAPPTTTAGEVGEVGAAPLAVPAAVTVAAPLAAPEAVTVAATEVGAAPPPAVTGAAATAPTEVAGSEDPEVVATAPAATAEAPPPAVTGAAATEVAAPATEEGLSNENSNNASTVGSLSLGGESPRVSPEAEAVAPSAEPLALTELAAPAVATATEVAAPAAATEIAGSEDPEVVATAPAATAATAATAAAPGPKHLGRNLPPFSISNNSATKGGSRKKRSKSRASRKGSRKKRTIKLRFIYKQ